MIFVNGFVHCDPHPGNILVSKSKNDEVKITMLDHGLYQVRIANHLSLILFRNLKICHNIVNDGFASWSFGMECW